MTTERPFLGLFDRASIYRLFLIVLAVSLVFIAEISLYARVFSLFSLDLVLAVTAGTGFLAFFWLAIIVRGLLKRILKDIQAGIFPEQLIVRLLGVIAGGMLLLLPGFISDILGLVILVSFLKRVAGRILLAIYGERIKGAYEYLKLS
ncbi:FxsA family protein [Marispirochaeta sp.]|uniref:FxsA family protein n=1 Tax=Marispirochaeta sp. TaxID=2038653 RepID=UPI0029C6F3D1|nr:FxsA family protein [Marispirochaeta sp.]